MLTEFSRPDRAAVESIRRALEEDSLQGRGLPDADPRSQSCVVELLPEQTGGRGISIVYRHSEDLDPF
ncbi:hypothetical protein AB0M58_38075 [Streptomyces bobili]|uniref:hypothetical protein n=1 Tax=Streptomyces bobili TaxID=67280 RepID=UPI0034262052